MRSAVKRQATRCRSGRINSTLQGTRRVGPTLVGHIIGLALGLLAGTPVHANPTGATVVHGNVQFKHVSPNVLEITNSPSSIINWQQFSIGQNETTRFIQDNAASAVLNRVTSQHPSSILGQLLSNGKVFVINPNGIVFG